MLDPALIQRIRAIFLHHEPRVTIAEAAGMLGWSRAEMNAAIRNGEIEVVETCSGKRIELRELATLRAPAVAVDGDRGGAWAGCDVDPAAGVADAEADGAAAAVSDRRVAGAGG